MAKEQTPSIDSIISQLKTSIANDVTLGGFTFKELSYEQQRKLINNGSSPIEFVVVVSNLLNDFITQCVEYADDVAEVAKTVTVLQKPFLINKLRTLNFGEEHVDGEKTYLFYDVKAEDFEIELAPKTIERGGLTINLRVPTIAVDTHFNKILIQALSGYKNKSARNITETEGGDVLMRYQLYELMKYIESFTFNGQTYDFTDMVPKSCVDFMNVLKAPMIKEITAYKAKIDRLTKKATTLTNKSDENDTMELNNLAEFFMIDLEDQITSI